MTEKTWLEGGNLFTEIKRKQRDLSVIDGQSVSVRVIFENHETNSSLEIELLKERAEELRSSMVSYYKEELNELQKQFGEL